MSDIYRIIEYKTDGKAIKREKKFLDEKLVEYLNTNSYIRINLSGKYLESIVEAEEKADYIIRVLNLFIFHFNANENQSFFTLKGRGYFNIMPILSVLGEQKFELHLEKLGYLFPFIIDESILNYMRENSLNRFIEICLKKVQLTELKKAVKKAIYWFAEGVAATHQATKFICYMFVIETLYGKSGDSLKHKLAERLATLSGTNKDERLFLYKTFKKLYDKRSKIVHAGSDEIDDLEIKDIRRMAFSSIYKVTNLIYNKEIKSQDKLFEYILESQFSFERV